MILLTACPKGIPNFILIDLEHCGVWKFWPSHAYSVTVIYIKAKVRVTDIELNSLAETVNAINLAQINF